jgi:asparagine synthase (glutamine-hydrolysing)
MILTGGHGKHLLRQVLYRHVPREMIDRPKQGFAVPIGDWLRGRLRDWAGDLLTTAAISRRGLIDPHVVATLWSEHQSRRFDHSARLWTVINLQSTPT